MKKIFNSLLFAVVACLPIFTSCEDDHDSNPTLVYPASFVLNTPEFATNNVCDLPAAEFVNLTTNQPNYGGWPAAVTYAVQVSLDPTDANGWNELTSQFTSTRINISATELNAKVLDMYRAANNDADPDGVLPLYFRLRAFLKDSGDNFGEVFSNVISMNVLSYDTPSDVTLPTAIFVCGNSIDVAWSTWKPLAPVYGKEGRFYTMIYNNADGFKWGYKANDWFGYDMITEFDNQVAGMNITAASDGNIVFDQAGWYVLEFICKVVGNEVQVKVVVAPGDACVIGNSVGDWSGISMTAPAGKGDWTFNSFIASEELRAYINVPGEDWWRTEFTLYNGELFWRTFDIPSNWKENVGEEYSVTAGPGKTLKIDFDKNTGSIE